MYTQEFQPQQADKPAYKKAWFWLLVTFGAFGALIAFVLAVGALVEPPGGEGQNEPPAAVEVNQDTELSAPANDVPREWENALNTGQRIADRNNSKQYVYRTLTSDVFGFPEDAAQYAIDNITDEWNERALKAAQELQERDNSHKYIHRTLTSDVFGFTEDEADYALANLEP